MNWNNILKYTGVHIFLKSIRPKVNIVARLVFELFNVDISIQHISHYVVDTPFVVEGKLRTEFKIWGKDFLFQYR